MQLLRGPAWLMRTPVPISAFSPPLRLPSLPALTICSSETEASWPFLNPGLLPSEEALLGRNREDWLTGIHKSFLG